MKCQTLPCISLYTGNKSRRPISPAAPSLLRCTDWRQWRRVHQNGGTPEVPVSMSLQHSVESNLYREENVINFKYLNVIFCCPNYVVYSCIVSGTYCFRSVCLSASPYNLILFEQCCDSWMYTLKFTKTSKKLLKQPSCTCNHMHSMLCLKANTTANTYHLESWWTFSVIPNDNNNIIQ